MFTPPPSPLPFPSSADPSTSSPPSLFLSTSGDESEFPFPSVASLPKSPKSPSKAEAGPCHPSLRVKKQTGRRILWLVIMVPVVMILLALMRQVLRYLMPIPPPVLQQSMLGKRDTPAPQSGNGNLTSTSALTSTSTPTASTASTGLPTVPTDADAVPTPFPQPFETLPANFSTAGCEAFFLNFTQDENFRQCRAFSLLLSASTEFLTAQHNVSLVNDIIYGTCNTPPTLQDCDSRMSTYLSQLQSVCSTEISNGNPVVRQAQIGFQSYTPMREVACQENAVSGRYCYIEAVAAVPPADIYFYALPLGSNIPKGVQTTCSPCVKSLLAIYSLYVDTMGGTGSGVIGTGQTSGNSTVSSINPTPLPVLSKTYPAAARLAVQQCGGTFANVGITSNSSNSAQPQNRRMSLNDIGSLSLGILLFYWIL